jgi:hypothetical protein
VSLDAWNEWHRALLADADAPAPSIIKEGAACRL